MQWEGNTTENIQADYDEYNHNEMIVMPVQYDICTVRVSYCKLGVHQVEGGGSSMACALMYCNRTNRRNIVRGRCGMQCCIGWWWRRWSIQKP